MHKIIQIVLVKENLIIEEMQIISEIKFNMGGVPMLLIIAKSQKNESTGKKVNKLFIRIMLREKVRS